jgi:hypothetical protein
MLLLTGQRDPELKQENKDMARKRREQPQVSSTDRFWSYFQEHTAKIMATGSQRAWEKHLSELRIRLTAVNSNLHPAIFEDDEGPIVVFSAGGGLALVPVVFDLVSAAPPLPSWRVFAFSMPNALHSDIQHCAPVIPDDDIRFTVVKALTGLQLTIYTDDDPNTHPSVRTWAKMLLAVIYGPTCLEPFTRIEWRKTPATFRAEESPYTLDEMGDVVMRLLTERTVYIRPHPGMLVPRLPR